MINPYRMVYVNIFLGILLLSGLLIYRYIYPKRKPNPLLLLILISLLPIFSILRKGVYQSGDFNLHIYRSIEFFKNLSQGNLMPSWGGELNMTLGYPVFIFNYILTYYIVAVLHFFGASFISAMKLFLAFSFVSSGIAMYLWTKKIFKNELQAFTSSIFYLFAPYHLVVLHFRVNGEILAFTFVPLIFYFVQKILLKPSVIGTLTIGLLYGLFYLAHPASAVFSLPIILIYTVLSLVNDKNNNALKKSIYIIIGCLIGMILASYVFVAHLFLSKFTYTSLVTGGLSYTPLKDLLYSPWRYGFLFQGPKGELSFLLGYTQIIVAIFFIILVLRRKIKKSQSFIVYFWLGTFLMSVYLITPWSDFLWKLIPLLSIAQFSYRISLISVLTISVLAGYLVLYVKQNKLIYLLILLTVSYTILNWGNRTTIPDIDDKYLKNNVPYSTLGYEGMAIMASPKWLPADNLWAKEVPKKHLEIITGNGVINEVERTETKHTYIIYGYSNTELLENTLYFPGWKIEADNKYIPINYLERKHLGKIVFNLPSGLHLINVEYKDIPIYRFSKIFSAISYFIIVFLLLFLILIKKIKFLK